MFDGDKLISFVDGLLRKIRIVNEGVSNSVHGGVVWYQMRLTF